VSEQPLAGLELCFEGAVPAVVATAAADGTPNITYLSRVQRIDDERIALSNQFFSKTARNLAENPRASVLLIDPTTYEEHRLTAVYERTERRGPVFERLRRDVDALAALEGMEGIFKLRAADVYRVLEVERVPRGAVHDVRDEGPGAPVVDPGALDATRSARLAELIARLSRCPDLDGVVSATVAGLAELFGYEHSLLSLLDEEGTRLYTIASHGFEAEGVGSEVVVGEGLIGMAAARCAPMRIGNLRQMTKYSRTVRRSFEEQHGSGPGGDIPLPALPEVQSRVSVPAMVLGQLVAVLSVESDRPVAFTEADEAVLTVVASVVANAIELERTQERAVEGAPPRPAPAPAPRDAEDPAHVRFYAVDGSIFLGGDYLIKGVAGRLLWSLAQQHAADGRVDFTNREVRLDPSLELPPFKDNLESRLILLKRRLDERDAPVRIEKTGRGRFRLVVDAPLRLEAAG
jgi:hypothetical protein